MINTDINNIIYYLKHFFPYSRVLFEVIFGVIPGERENLFHQISEGKKIKDQSNKADLTGPCFDFKCVEIPRREEGNIIKFQFSSPSANI